jgi:hypothetical protein
VHTYIYICAYIIYIHIWKCHSETPCITIINIQRCLFKKTKDRKVKQVLFGELVPMEGGQHKERVHDNGSTVYSCIKVEQ